MKKFYAICALIMAILTVPLAMLLLFDCIGKIWLVIDIALLTCCAIQLDTAPTTRAEAKR